LQPLILKRAELGRLDLPWDLLSLKSYI
jgi:hypothetical protein